MITRPRRQNAKLASLGGYSAHESSRSSLSTTPYRLPRRSDEKKSPREEKYCVVKSQESSSPRPTRFDGPSFSHALIAPNCSPRLVATDPSDPIFRNLTRARTTAFEMQQQPSTHFPEVDPSPTPIIGRARTPAQTLTLSHAYTYPTTATHLHGSETSTAIEWTLSPYKHNNIDRKGQQRNQGPFSREFTVRVMAPNNWLRMKWGRQYRRYLPPLTPNITMT